MMNGSNTELKDRLRSDRRIFSAQICRGGSAVYSGRDDCRCKRVYSVGLS